MFTYKNNIIIRTIEADDDIFIARIIRESLAEFGANRPGTVFYDDTTDCLSKLFGHQQSIYYMIEQEKEILGGGGIFPSAGLPPDTCELVKMYLKPNARGLGLGKRLLDLCIDFASSQSFRYIYLETMPELTKALGLYEENGFTYLSAPLGDTGHYGCAIWMRKQLQKKP